MSHARRIIHFIGRLASDWRFVLASAVLALSITALVAIVSVTVDRDDLRRQLQAQEDVVNCRNQLSAELTNRQADYLLSFGASAIAGFAGTDEQLVDELTELGRTAEAFSTARDARLAFEDNPTGDC